MMALPMSTGMKITDHRKAAGKKALAKGMRQAFVKGFAEALPKELSKQFRQPCLNLMGLLLSGVPEGFAEALKPNKNDSQEQRT